MLFRSKGIRHGIAARKTAGNRNKIADLELPGRLRFNEVENVGDGYAGHGIVLYLAARMKSRLEVDPADGRVLDRKVDNPADLVQPRGETPAYTMRRTTVMEKYRAGSSPATTYPTLEGKISDIAR